MLTLGQLRSHVRLALGGDPSTMPGMTVEDRIAEIVNHAGEALYSHDWRFRERTAAPLTLVGGQSWLELPADADELISVETIGAMPVAFRIMTPADFHRAQTAAVPPSIGYVACLSQGTGPGQPDRRLDVFPTPMTTSSTELSVRYRAAWSPVAAGNADSLAMPVPAYAEPVLVQLVRAFAEGGEDGSDLERVARVEASPTMLMARRKDGSLQPDYGQLQPRPTEGGGPPAIGYAAMVADQRLVPIDFAAGDWTGGTLTIPEAMHGRGSAPLIVQVYHDDGAIADVDIAIDGDGNVTVTHPLGGFAGDVRIFG